MHFISTFNMQEEEITGLLDLAEHYREINNNGSRLPLDILRGKTVGMLFFEPSTRTKGSFELATYNLGGNVINLELTASSVVKGESVLDTARTFQAMGVNALVVRHTASGTARYLAERLDIPVINAGDGTHEHPTQAMLDLLTIRQEFGSLKGLSVLLMGDIRHSRVARSNLYAMCAMGLRVRLAGPPTLIPAEMVALGAEVENDFERALCKVDVVYVLRIQRERQQGGLLPSLSEYTALYGINEQRMNLMKEQAIIMHPGPVNVGVELTPAACASPRARLLRQVNNGVAVRMAVLHRMLHSVETAP